MSRQTAVESPESGSSSDGPRGENVLVLASSMESDADERCVHLADEADGLLVVSLSEAPDRRIDTISARGGRPDRVAAISCDTTRGAAAARFPSDGGTPDIATVSDPGDLTGIGIHIDQLLTAWDGLDHVAVCVDSLTTLLQYSDPRAVFRFCHSVTRKASDVGATTHFHLDPGTVDDQTRRTFQSLFDRTVEA